jgi:hypothetical protein
MTVHHPPTRMRSMPTNIVRSSSASARLQNVSRFVIHCPYACDLRNSGVSDFVQTTSSSHSIPSRTLCWYLALNRARLPETKEATIARCRHALER